MQDHLPSGAARVIRERQDGGSGRATPNIVARRPPDIPLDGQGSPGAAISQCLQGTSPKKEGVA